MSKIKSIIALFFLFSFFSTLFAEDKIVWFQHQRPPWMINNGEFQNQGYGDKIRQIFEKKLNQYKHITLGINPSRFYKEIKRRDNVCYGPVMKLSSIKNLFHWSKPLYILPQHSIIVLEDTFKELGSPKELSMQELLSNTHYTFGKIANMNYFPFDINAFKEQNNIITLSTSGSTTGLLNMMQKKRVDWIYDFNMYIKWQYQQMNLKKTSKYKTIKVSETKNYPKIVAHIACYKNEFGKEVIEKINQTLTKETIYDIRKLVREWQLDDASLKEFDELNYGLFGY